MKLNIALVMMVAIALLCGASVMAGTNVASTSISATSDPIILTMSAPASVGPVTLIRNADNPIPISGVSISSNVGGSGVPCHVVLTTSSPSGKGMQSGGSTVYLSHEIQMLSKDGLTWNSLTTANPIWDGSLSTTPIPIPVTIDQFVAMDDTPAEDYHISVTFTLSQVTP